MTNTQRTDGVVTLSERRNFFIDELAKTIAAMFDSGETREVLDKLYEAISKANYELLHSNADLLEYFLDIEPTKLRSELEETQKEWEAEDSSEMIAEKERQLQKQGEKFFAGFMMIKDLIGTSGSDSEASLITAQNLIARLDEIEHIAAMTDFTERCEAYVDYFARNMIETIEVGLQVTAFGAGGTLETEDIQHIIKTNYLNTTHSKEMETLAGIFGRDDISRKAETPYESIRRMFREEEITKFLDVLENMITRKSNLETATLLVENGADVNATDQDGATLLHSAVENNDQETTTLLVENGADVNGRNHYGETPLHYAARRNAQQTAEILLKNGADVNGRNQYIDTPLHYAARNDAQQTAEILLKNGAGVNATNQARHTPRYYASKKTTKVLRAYGGKRK